MKLSAPKPISAIEPAAIPAPTAIANSTTCQAIPPQASIRARRSSLFRSADGRIEPSWTSPAPWSDTRHRERQDGRHERAPLLGQGVHHHLPLATRTDQAVCPQGPHMMRDEIL